MKLSDFKGDTTIEDPYKMEFTFIAKEFYDNLPKHTIPKYEGLLGFEFLKLLEKHPSIKNNIETVHPKFENADSKIIRLKIELVDGERSKKLIREAIIKGFKEK